MQTIEKTRDVSYWTNGSVSVEIEKIGYNPITDENIYRTYWKHGKLSRCKELEDKIDLCGMITDWTFDNIKSCFKEAL